MKIALASDHAGYHYKEILKDHLTGMGHHVEDFGAHSEESCDYPDFIHPAADAVASGDAEAAIIFGGSGNGEAIAANKTRGIRCAVCWNTESATLAKTHNNANVISIGQRMVSRETMLAIVDSWLAAEFEGGRHDRRIAKIER